MPSVGSGVTDVSDEVRNQKEHGSLYTPGLHLCGSQNLQNFKILNACPVIVGIFKYIHTHTYVNIYIYLIQEVQGRGIHL